MFYFIFCRFIFAGCTAQLPVSVRSSVCEGWLVSGFIISTENTDQLYFRFVLAYLGAAHMASYCDLPDVRPSVCPSVRPSVRLSVRRLSSFVRPSSTAFIQYLLNHKANIDESLQGGSMHETLTNFKEFHSIRNTCSHGNQ